MRYTDLRGSLQTGDIVLCQGGGSGMGYLVSRIISRACRSPWTHIGMVYRDPILDVVQVWDSTSLSRGDTVRDGPALTPASRYVREYKGRVFVRPLHADREALDMSGPPGSGLAAWMWRMRGRTYERDYVALAGALVGALDDGDTDLSSVFCSELVAGAYQAMGLLPTPDPPPDSYTPADFGVGGCVEERLLLGALGAPVEIEG